MQNMELKDELKVVSGRKRRFILLRIIDIETEAARQLCSISKGTYNTWLHNDAFKQLYRRRAELSAEHREDALRLLRRDNQQHAIFLEEKILQKMKKEIESGEYDLIRTNLAREVYSKLIADLDYQPKSLALSWEQRVQMLNQGKEVPQLEQGGEDAPIIVETVSVQSPEHPQGEHVSESEQAPDETEEKTEEG